MSSSSKNDLRAAYEGLGTRYKILIGLVLFIGGLLCRVVSISRTAWYWEGLGELGVVLSTSIAISFIYETLIKRDQRLLFLNDLKVVLDERLADIPSSRGILRCHESGRMTIETKVAFFNEAKREVIQVGLGLSSFAGYFTSRPHHEFAEPFENALRRGVNFRMVFLDPDSMITTNYASETQEESLVEGIRKSLDIYRKLRDKFKQKNLHGQLQITLYSRIPSCWLLMVDPMEDDGRMYMSSYLPGVNRADAPVIEIHKSSNPIAFGHYHRFANGLLRGGRKV